MKLAGRGIAWPLYKHQFGQYDSKHPWVSGLRGKEIKDRENPKRVYEWFKEVLGKVGLLMRKLIDYVEKSNIFISNYL